VLLILLSLQRQRRIGDGVAYRYIFLLVIFSGNLSFPVYILSIRMPPKRSPLQSPNPVKHQMLDAYAAPSPSDTVTCVNSDDTEIVPADLKCGSVAAPTILPPLVGAPAAGEYLHAHKAIVVGGAIVAPHSSCPIDYPGAIAASAPFVLQPDHPITPPRLDHGQLPLASQSPSTNRSRFLQGCQPVRISCNLDLMRSPAGAKIAITAICIAVFPASRNPDRRYIQLSDQYGSAGLTVWNLNVSLFGPSSVGKVVQCKRLVVQSHNGKRCLTMARDSTIEVDDDGQHAVMDWWKGLLHARARNALEAHNSEDNDIITLSGVVGQVTEETKVVNGAARVLTTIHMVDATGKFMLRTWNHVHQQFQAFIDKPVSIQRVRVVSFAGEKLAEFLDGNGSVILTDFPGCSTLLDWWNSA